MPLDPQSSPQDPDPTPSRARPPAAFQTEYERACLRLRGALIQLYAAAGADPDRPQAVSKGFTINRNVAWKLSRLIHATDPFEMHPHLPGSAGMGIVLEAFARRGAPPAALDAVRGAWAEFEEVVERHAGDRRRLSLLLASLSAQEGSGDEGLTARRGAFEGQSAVFGAQAGLRLGVAVIAPNPQDAMRADIVNVSGLLDFRRLRETTRWPLIQLQGFSSEGSTGVGRRAPLDPRPDGAPLLYDFSSSPPPELVSTELDNVRTYELRSGPVGRSGAVDAVFGTVIRAGVPIYDPDRDPGSVGEHYCRIDTPVERVLFDLYLHRDLPLELPPRVAFYSLLHAQLHFPLTKHERFLMPVPGKVQELGIPPMASTPFFPRHVQLVEFAASALGLPLDVLRGYRYELAYPPVPSIAVLYHALPPQP